MLMDNYEVLRLNSLCNYQDPELEVSPAKVVNRRRVVVSSCGVPGSTGGCKEEASTSSPGTCTGSCIMDRHIFHGEEGSWKSTTMTMEFR